MLGASDELRPHSYPTTLHLKAPVYVRCCCAGYEHQCLLPKGFLFPPARRYNGTETQVLLRKSVIDSFIVELINAVGVRAAVTVPISWKFYMWKGLYNALQAISCASHETATPGGDTTLIRLRKANVRLPLSP